MDVNNIQPGDILPLKGFIALAKGGHLTFIECDMSAYGYTMLGPYSIAFVVPEGFNPDSSELGTIDNALFQAKKEYSDKRAQLMARKLELAKLEQFLEDNNVPNP